MLECVEFIKDQDLADAIDLVETRAVDFFMNEESWLDANDSLKHYKEAGGDLAGIVAHGKEEADLVRLNTAHLHNKPFGC